MRAAHVELLERRRLGALTDDILDAAATFLLGQGFTLEEVKNLLGHSSITLTSNTYGHVLEQRQRQVATAMDAAPAGIMTVTFASRA